MTRAKTTQHLGELTGKLLIFGGVYSNLQSLQKLKSIAEAEGYSPDRIICTGDVVAYCAQPVECLRMIDDWGVLLVAGNVEISLREGENDCGCDFSMGSRCDIFSRSWYPFALSKMQEEELDILQDIPDFLTFDYYGKKITVLHGSHEETAEYVFASDNPERRARIFAETDSDIILAGHCGLPFTKRENRKLWLNAGVIGMPANDGTPRVWYATLEKRDGEIIAQHHAYEYDATTARALMYDNKLPIEYAETLLTGEWDNCEILPETETAARGVRLTLAD